MIALFKTLHIAALVIWCACLLALPLLLGLHERMVHAVPLHQLQHSYAQFRRLTHVTYTVVATPSAVIAIAAGTVLIFAAQVLELWLLAKLAFVAGMALVHAWLGHLILQSKERELGWRMPWPALALVLAIPCMLAVLWLVLAKPDLRGVVAALPDWSREPLHWDVGRMLAALWAKWWPGQEALP